ncbi:pyrroline-5-carboxylate reductase [Pseudoclavibacter chungangensis]|uniref:NAD(P)-binding domain-containing protein n=1 Tax=Pseudoclavibacter chungangensis TaxID=587635 RepID=UPI0015CB14B8|nr:NAD(P)-binding domain-containing protein [Pseudoclavibacter chungangensis]NYJ66366.1 pyrroline-5-carboxylate reductase [Pseudoclavibacter chungangensis]
MTEAGAHDHDPSSRGSGGSTLDVIGAVGLIGVGEIASAIVDGLCEGRDEAPPVYLSPRNAETAAALAARYPSVRVCRDNQEVVDASATVILSVRPDIAVHVLDELRIPEGRLLVSAVAGLTHESVRQSTGEHVTVVRAIPLPSVRQREGVTAIFAPDARASELFDGLGGTLAVDEAAAFDAIQATTATLPTHLAYLSAIAVWLDSHGVRGPAAEGYVRSMFRGLAGALDDGSRSLSELALAHETPAGINEQLRSAWFTNTNRDELAHTLDDVLARLRP